MNYKRWYFIMVFMLLACNIFHFVETRKWNSLYDRQRILIDTLLARNGSLIDFNGELLRLYPRELPRQHSRYTPSNYTITFHQQQ